MRQVVKIGYNRGVLKVVIPKEMAKEMEFVSGDRVMVEIVNSHDGLWKHITIRRESE